MDRLTTIARGQWRAFWRRFKRAGNLNAGNQGILLIFAVLVLVRYLQSLQIAARELPRGNARLFKTLLLGILLVWLFPLAGNARMSLVTRKLAAAYLSWGNWMSLRLIPRLTPQSAHSSSRIERTAFWPTTQLRFFRFAFIRMKSAAQRFAAGLRQA